MATKEEKAENIESRTNSSQNAEISADGNSSQAQGDYIHNPEDFIDIHGSHPYRPVQCTNNGSQNSATTENEQDLPETERDIDFPSTEREISYVESETGFSAIQNLKVPVQVSEEHDTHSPTACDSKHCVSSDEEYQSADEGNGGWGRTGNCEADENCDEEYKETEDSDDDFMPAGDDNYCVGEEGDSSTTERQERCAATKEDNDQDEMEEEKEPEITDDLAIRKKQEELLTEEEKQARKQNSQTFKDDGNSKFHSGDYDAAIEAYTEALEICPLNFLKERSIMYSNRAACKMKKELYNEAIKDCSNALDLHPHYIKALLRRAELYEKTENLDEALKDYQKAIELDPSLHSARAACVKLAEQIRERNEKMKEEMMGKLKDLGNMVLRPFGLSVNNFNLQQDPNTGSYSVQFQQSPPNNGS